jgi:hypothetical protein
VGYLILGTLGITLDKNANYLSIRAHPMWQQKLPDFSDSFRRACTNRPIVLENRWINRQQVVDITNREI